MFPHSFIHHFSKEPRELPLDKPSNRRTSWPLNKLLKSKDKLEEGTILKFPTGYKKMVKKDPRNSGAWFHACDENKCLLGYANDVEFYGQESWVEPNDGADLSLYLDSIVPQTHQGVSILDRSLEVKQSEIEKKMKRKQLKDEKKLKRYSTLF